MNRIERDGKLDAELLRRMNTVGGIDDDNLRSEYLRIIVRCAECDFVPVIELIEDYGGRVWHRIPSIGALAVSLSLCGIWALTYSPYVQWIETDHLITIPSIGERS